jgi:hypothetical protein
MKRLLHLPILVLLQQPVRTLARHTGSRDTLNPSADLRTA